MLAIDPSEEPGVLVYVTVDGGRSWSAHAAPGISPNASTSSMQQTAGCLVRTP